MDNRIKIIGIDEKSLEEMGPFSGWTRQQSADLLNAFDKEYSPAVIAFDINFVGQRDQEGDQALAEAASGFPHVVVKAVNTLYLPWLTALLPVCLPVFVIYFPGKIPFFNIAFGRWKQGSSLSQSVCTARASTGDALYQLLLC